MEDKNKKYQKYRKKKNCGYPFSPSKFGYCWSYALQVDAGKVDEEIEKDCVDCEYYVEKETKGE